MALSVPSAARADTNGWFVASSSTTVTTVTPFPAERCPRASSRTTLSRPPALAGAVICRTRSELDRCLTVRGLADNPRIDGQTGRFVRRSTGTYGTKRITPSLARGNGRARDAALEPRCRPWRPFCCRRDITEQLLGFL